MRTAYEFCYTSSMPDNFNKSIKIKGLAQIHPIQVEQEPYEADISYSGFSFHILIGSQINGRFLCIPNWQFGCELAGYDDIIWNRESIMKEDGPFGIDTASAISYGISWLNNYFIS